MSMKKKSVVMSALMATVITGNVYAAELSENDKAFYDALNNFNALGDFNNDNTIDENDYLILKDKVGDTLTEENLKNAATELKQTIETGQVKDAVNDFVNSLPQDYQNVANDLLSKVDNTDKEAIKNAVNDFMTKVENTDKEEVETAVGNFINNLPQEYKDAAKDLLEKIAGTTTPEGGTTTTPEGGNATTGSGLKDALNNLLGKLQNGDTQGIKDAVNNFVSKVPDDQKQAVKDLLSGLISGETGGALGDALQGATTDFKGINDKLGELVSFTEKMEKTLAEAKAKAEAFAGSAEENLAKVDAKIKESVDKIESKVNGFEDKLQANLDKVDEKIKEKVEAIEGKVVANLDKVEDKLKDNLAKVDEKIKANGEAIKDKIQDNLTQVDNKLKENLVKVDEKIQENVAKVEDKLQANIGRVEAEAKDFVGDVKDHLDKSHATHEELFDRTTDISYDEKSSTTKVENNLTVGGNLVVNPGGDNQVQITEDGIKVGKNSVYISGNDVSIGDPKTDPNAIKLSTLGNVSNVNPDLQARPEFDGTVVGAVNAEAAKRAEVDGQLGQAIVDETNRAIEAEGQLAQAIQNETERAAKAEGELAQAIQNETDRAAKAEGELAQAIQNETERAAKAEGELAQAIQNEANKRAEVDGQLGQAIVDETKRAQGVEHELSTAITNEAKARKEEDDRIRSELNSEVGRLDNKITRLEDRVDKVGAMAAAIASLKTMGYDPEAPTEIAVGVGQYRSNTGMAVGAFHYPNRDFMLNFNVSTAGEEVMGGVGATWRLGRKNANNTAEAKIAKAEALKAAAKAARENAK